MTEKTTRSRDFDDDFADTRFAGCSKKNVDVADTVVVVVVEKTIVA